MFKKHYCTVCSRHIKWYQKIVVETKISRLTDKAGNVTPYRHYEIRHYNCLTPIQKREWEQEKKRKKKKGDNNDTSNLDKIRVD